MSEEKAVAAAVSKEALIAAMRETAKNAPEPVDVPKWGRVFVRAVTVSEVEEQAADTKDKNDKNRIARAVARVLCDEHGNRMFDPNNEEEVALLASQPWTLLRKLLPSDSD